MSTQNGLCQSFKAMPASILPDMLNNNFLKTLSLMFPEATGSKFLNLCLIGEVVLTQLSASGANLSSPALKWGYI